MSLILRKECQPILDECGLENFHVKIDDYSKNLVIATECDRPFITVNGITFTRNKPTVKEIEYAKELFNAFIVKYNDQIQNYLNESKKLKQLENNLPKFEDNDIGFSPAFKQFQYIDNEFTIIINKDKLINKIKYKSETVDNGIVFPKDGIFKLDKKLFDDMHKVLLQCIKHQEQYQLVEKIKNELNSCNI